MTTLSTLRICLLATNFFAKPTTAAEATAAGKAARLRTDRRQPADPQARSRAEHRTTASTANHTAADRQTRSRQTRQHDQQSRGTPNATANAANREARRTDRTSQQPKSHAHSRNAEQHATAAKSGTPQTENGKPSKADDRDDQTNKQTTQQTPPDRQTKHDSPQRRPPRATSWLRGWRGAQCPVAVRAALAAGLRAVDGNRAIMEAPWRHYDNADRARRRPFATKQIRFN